LDVQYIFASWRTGQSNTTVATIPAWDGKSSGRNILNIGFASSGHFPIIGSARVSSNSPSKDVCLSKRFALAGRIALPFG
jgi:hypothetical protein